MIQVAGGKSRKKKGIGENEKILKAEHVLCKGLK